MTSLAAMTADVDDSVMTTASNMTTASKASKKTAKTRKAPASRAKKTRAKKSDAVEVHEDVPMTELEPVPEPELVMQEMTPLPPPKPAGGRKRTSDEVEDSVATNAEAPAPKKRATKTRKARDSSATEVSSTDAEMLGVPKELKKPAVKKGARKASAARKASGKRIRKVSASAVASTVSSPPQIPGDDEIDRQLEADLERSLDEDEDAPIDADPETMRAAACHKKQVVSEVAMDMEDDALAHTAKTNFAMFDPNPPQPTDEEIEADLQAMQDAMDLDVKELERPQEQPLEQEQEAEAGLKMIKKGRKTGTKKTSKQTATKKGKEHPAPFVEHPQLLITADAEVDEIAEAEVSFASADTVKRTSVGRASLGRASLPRASLDSAASTTNNKGPAKRGRPPKDRASQVAGEEPAVVSQSDAVVYPTLETEDVHSASTTAVVKAPAKRGRPAKKKASQALAEEPAEVAPPLPTERVSEIPVEEPNEAATASDPVVYPTLETMEMDDEPTPKAISKTEKRPATGKPRGRPPKSKTSGISSGEPTIVHAPAEPEPESEHEPVHVPEPATETDADTEAETQEVHVQDGFSSAANSPQIARKPIPPPKDSASAIQRQALGPASIGPPELIVPPKTPRHHTATSRSAKQATISPSPSPQASDAENKPPSSKPGTNSSKRMPLGELPVTTPARQISPSKQQQHGKVIAGLQSTETWTAVDLDLVFEGGENGAVAAERFFADGSELSATEREMTVEEWIYYNAGRAEVKLKNKCEAMVSAFEGEGTRAMRVLEGLVVE